MRNVVTGTKTGVRTQSAPGSWSNKRVSRKLILSRDLVKDLMTKFENVLWWAVALTVSVFALYGTEEVDPSGRTIIRGVLGERLV